jgi:8-oxo-dGTP pyrophosphatase MutT (NUDIX family)
LPYHHSLIANNDPPENETLVSHLQSVLSTLVASPYPVLTTETTKKRASVALIVRINPSYSHWPEPSAARPESIVDFYEQDWVKHGDPEVLFIKRASRKGDRWTSHVAFPGGRRDPEDEDDKAAAVRETWEEVGLDLKSYAIDCGNLPQRLVTTHWGKTPLMVLCPYVFLLTEHNTPPLKLQPTEVASTHWVPLRSLLMPSQRTVVFEDVSSRLANQETGVKKWMLSLVLGKMMFAAIHLAPTESLHSFETPAAPLLQSNRYSPPTTSSYIEGFVTRLMRFDPVNQTHTPAPEHPLLLWGLTLGVVADFLDLLPPHNALTLWTYPTFTPIDVRAAIWLLTYRFKHRKRAELQAGTALPSPTDSPRPARDDARRRSFGAATESTVPVSAERPDETGFHGLGTGLGENKGKKAAVATLLEGLVSPVAELMLPEVADRGRYYDIVRKAVALALVGRAGIGALVGLWAWRKWKSGGR